MEPFSAHIWRTSLPNMSLFGHFVKDAVSGNFQATVLSRHNSCVYAAQSQKAKASGSEFKNQQQQKQRHKIDTRLQCFTSLLSSYHDIVFFLFASATMKAASTTVRCSGVSTKTSLSFVFIFGTYCMHLQHSMGRSSDSILPLLCSIFFGAGWVISPDQLHTGAAFAITGPLGTHCAGRYCLDPGCIGLSEWRRKLGRRSAMHYQRERMRSCIDSSWSRDMEKRLR